jgi:hypothetical protein
MTALSRIGLAFAIAQCVNGCAIQSSTTPSAFVTSPRAKVVALNRTKEAVVIGKSTKADVIAALGETLVISFDTGYEVWVYRLANARDAEFVILFAGSGVVTKTRNRPAPQGA